MERREKCFRSLTFVLFILFLIWIFLQFLSPLALPKDSVQDLSGLVVVYDNEHTIDNMDFPWSIVYSAGDRLCHQKAERSFFINGNQMPFCSRCTAIFFGLASGLGFMIFYQIQLNEKFLLAIIVCIIPLALDGIGQLFNLWESTNLIRVITGLLTGTAFGLAISVIIDEIKTFHIFENYKN
jgi:uncharacterized membrane protein